MPVVFFYPRWGHRKLCTWSGDDEFTVSLEPYLFLRPPRVQAFRAGPERLLNPLFSYSRSMRSSPAKSTPEKDLLLMRRFSISFLARRKWRILSPSFTYTSRSASKKTNKKKADYEPQGRRRVRERSATLAKCQHPSFSGAGETNTHQTGSLIAHSWLVVKNSPLSTLVLNAVPFFPNTICCCCSSRQPPPSPPNNRDLRKLFHNPNKPTAATGGTGVEGICSRGAMIVRTSGRTCESCRSAAPIMRAIVGIASAPPTRRPKLAVVRRIVRAAAAAKSSSFTGAASACS
jgi:hypothetical protein